MRDTVQNNPSLENMGVGSKDDGRMDNYYVRVIELANKFREGKPWIEVLHKNYAKDRARFYLRRISSETTLPFHNDPAKIYKGVSRILGEYDITVDGGTQLNPGWYAYAINVDDEGLEKVMEALKVKPIPRKDGINRHRKSDYLSKNKKSGNILEKRLIKSHRRIL